MWYSTLENLKPNKTFLLNVRCLLNRADMEKNSPLRDPIELLLVAHAQEALLHLVIHSLIVLLLNVLYL